MANRYTNITPSRFNPLSMQEIFTVPLAKQKQHDESQARLDELGLFDINRLSEDDPAVNEYLNEYRSKIDTEVDNMLSRGVNHATNRNIRGLIRDRQNWMSQDQLGGKAQANYKAYTDYKNTLDKQLADEKIDLNTYNAALSQSRAGYSKGITGNGSLNLQALSNKVDISDYLQSYAKDMMSNPRLIEDNTGLKHVGNGMMVNVKTGQKGHAKDFIGTALNNIAKTDPSIQNYLSQQNKLGLIPDVDKYLGHITDTMGASYSKNEYSEDFQYKNIPGAGTNTNETDTTTLPTYELGGAESIKIRGDKFSERLNRVLLDEVIEDYDDVKPKRFIMGGDGRPVKNEGYEEQMRTYNQNKPNADGSYNLGEFEGEFNMIRDGLLSTNVIPPQFRGNKEMEIQYVKDYLDSHKDITYQPKKQTSGLFKTYGGLNIKQDNLNPEKLFKNISAQVGPSSANSRVIIDPETKEVINFKDLSSDEQEYFNMGKGIVSGVWSPENYLKDQVKVGASDEVLTSPYEVKLPNGRKLLVGRSASELNSPAYQTDMLYNDIWRHTTKMPDIPYRTKLNGLGDVEISNISNGTTDSEGNTITKSGIYIKQLGNDNLNKPMYVPSYEVLETFMQKLYNINKQ